MREQNRSYSYEPVDLKYRDVRQARQLRYRASVLLNEAVACENRAAELELSYEEC